MFETRSGSAFLIIVINSTYCSIEFKGSYYEVCVFRNIERELIILEKEEVFNFLNKFSLIGSHFHITEQKSLYSNPETICHKVLQNKNAKNILFAGMDILKKLKLFTVIYCFLV